MLHAKEKLYVLYLEDLEKDVEIVHQTLMDDLECPVFLDWAATESEYIEFITNNDYDVILADYTLPGYNAEAALKAARSMGLNLPFICISGTIGEDIAVELLKQGATDYVLKDRLGRLAFAVERAINEAKEKEEHKRALRVSEESNRLMLDSSNDGIAMLDEAGTVLNINAQFEKRYNKTKQEMIGMNIRNLSDMQQTIGNQRLQQIKSIFETGVAVSVEDTLNGLTYSNSYYPVFTEGKVTAVTFFSTDITDKKKAQEEASRNVRLRYETEILRKKEQEYLEILEGSTEGSWIYDCLNNTVELSPQCLKLIKAENIPPMEHINSVRSFLHPDHMKAAIEQWTRVLKHKLSKYSIELELKEIAKWVLLQGKILYNCEGDPVKIYGIVMDITSRKKAEEALRQSESLLRAIIEGTTDVVILKDRESRILLTNSATAGVFGIKTSEILGKSNLDYYSDKEKALLVMENDRRIMEKDKAEVLEEVVPSIRGCRTFLSSKVPWHDPDGNVIGIIVISRDISDRKAIESELKKMVEELDHKNKLITDFFTNISHEFKTPLSVILIQLELMNLYLDDKEKIKQMISVITQNSYRLTRLIGNLLDITKINAGYLKVNYVYTDIVDLLRNICDSVEAYTKARFIHLSFKPTVHKKIMPLDIDNIERILLNLLSNAIKHTGKGGEIQMCVDETADGGVRISVEDTGTGIPENKLNFIFNRFSQVDTSFERLNEGCGIGLALVKAIVEIANGSIYVESELGKGSKFIFELPIIEIDVKSTAAGSRVINFSKKVQMELSDL